MKMIVQIPIVYIVTLIVIVQGGRGSVEGFDATRYKHGLEWIAWKQTHNKTYQSYHEELGRFNIWLKNKQYIDRHNQQQAHTYTLRMNHFGDMVSIYTCINVYTYICHYFDRLLKNLLRHIVAI